MVAAVVDALVRGLVLPLGLLPVATVAGVGLSKLAGPCAQPCEAPGLLAVMVWALLVVAAAVAYKPVLRRLGRRSLGQWVAGMAPPAARRGTV